MRKETEPSQKSCKSHDPELPRFSPAIMEIVENNLRKDKERADEAFLIRIQMDRKLSSL